MKVKEALGLERGEMVSLIGAGGKTTTLFHLSKELHDEGGKVLVTTTTKIFKPTKPHVHRLFLAQAADALLEATSQIRGPVVIGAGYSVDDDGKLVGLPSDWLDLVQQSRRFDWILVEADGAASRLFKVPSETEPVVPESCQLTVWIMAIKVLGRPLEPEWVHRAEKAAPLLGVAPATPVTSELIIQLIENPKGCLKGIPRKSRKAALINQADSSEEIFQAKNLGQALVQHGFERAIVTSYLDNDPVKSVMIH